MAAGTFLAGGGGVADAAPATWPSPPEGAPILNGRFREWFGGSQVAGADGSPLTVYHGTPGGPFDAFDRTRKGKTTFIGIPVDVQRHGFYFAEDPHFAASFARQGDGRGGSLIAVYLSIRRPLRMQSSGLYWRDVEALAAQGVDRRWLEEHAGDPRESWEALDDGNGAFLVGAVRAAGFDGILMDELCPETDEVKAVWVAFEPCQIKSVHNPGTWDRASGRLRDAEPMRGCALRVPPRGACRAHWPDGAGTGGPGLR